MSLTEADWELKRLELAQLCQQHPDWSITQLVAATQTSASWVKKWRRRWRGKPRVYFQDCRSASRAPKQRAKVLHPLVRDTILSLRDELKDTYQRVVGPKTIRYHLHKDPLLQTRKLWLPRSPHTIWKILKDGGRIPTRVKEHHALDRPEPMTHWECDFGQLADRVEFLSVVDRGTSILVDTQAQLHYNAESALLAVAQLLILNGLPDKLRFDRDTRFVGSANKDSFPSPLQRFLLCIGVQPDITPPRRPDLKPFVERSIRTLKYECLWAQRPATVEQTAELLQRYRYFYNHERANQAVVCGNRPPYEAFPLLPTRPTLPEEVDPDAWTRHFDRHIFKRRVAANGMVSVDRHEYYVGNEYAGERVGMQLDGIRHQWTILHRGQTIKTLDMKGVYHLRLPFGEYLQLMLSEARVVDQTVAHS